MVATCCPPSTGKVTDSIFDMSAESLERERQHAGLYFAGVVCLCLVPYVAYCASKGQWMLAVCSVSVFVAFAVNAIASYRAYRPLIGSAYLTPLISTLLLAMLSEQGAAAAFWCFPAVVSPHFLLNLHEARRAEYSLLTVSLAGSYFFLDPPLSIWLFPALLLTNSVCRLYLHVISRQRASLHSMSVTLQSKVEELKQANDRLSQSEVHRRQFLSDISHSVGTPLATVQMGLQSLRSTAGEENEALIDRLVSQAAWVGQVSKRLVALSRWESSAPDLKLEQIDLAVAISEIIDLFEDQILAADLEIKISGMRGMKVKADRSGLRDILSVFVENCVQHSGGGCSLCFEAKRSAESVVLIVEDNGRGTDIEQLPDLEHGFYRSGGTGLGLPLASRLIVAHGGSLTITSNYGVGFKAEISLPSAE